jgi:hypothetical protein
MAEPITIPLRIVLTFEAKSHGALRVEPAELFTAQPAPRASESLELELAESQSMRTKLSDALEGALAREKMGDERIAQLERELVAANEALEDARTQLSEVRQDGEGWKEEAGTLEQQLDASQGIVTAWRLAIEEALGLEGNVEQHTPGWAMRVVREQVEAYSKASAAARAAGWIKPHLKLDLASFIERQADRLKIAEEELGKALTAAKPRPSALRMRVEPEPCPVAELPTIGPGKPLDGTFELTDAEADAAMRAGECCRDHDGEICRFHKGRFETWNPSGETWTTYPAKLNNGAGPWTVVPNPEGGKGGKVANG